MVKRNNFGFGLKNPRNDPFGTPKYKSAIGLLVNPPKRMNWKQAKKAYPFLKPMGDWDSDGTPNSLDCRPFDPLRHKISRKEKTQRELEEYKGQLRKETAREYKKQLGRELRRDRISEYSQKRVARRKIIPRLVQSAFPMVQKQTGDYDSSRGRGRPRGAYSSKYASYGGVFGYRKFLRAQNAMKRYQGLLQLQRMQQQMQQQVPQQYQQQVQEVIPEEEQYPSQQQIPQISQLQAQQQAQMPIRREVTPVFKSSGGKPYPAVNTAPLQGDRYSEYYEDTDLLSGKRRMLRRLPAEGWMR